MQEKAGEQGAAYIPMPKGRGFTPHVDNIPMQEGSQQKGYAVLVFTVPPEWCIIKAW